VVREDALPIAVEARELGKSAHKRLDIVNGSLDRMNGKMERLDEKVDKRFDEVNGKLNSILISQAMQAGGQQVTTTFIDRRWAIVAIIVTIATSGVAALLLTFALRGHP
jgi:tetrahydromethanopterin S-methyltransferase subunit G